MSWGPAPAGRPKWTASAAPDAVGASVALLQLEPVVKFLALHQAACTGKTENPSCCLVTFSTRRRDPAATFQKLQLEN